MAEKKETKTEKRRAQINQLPKEERQLSKDEQKKIKGGGGLMSVLNTSRSQQG